MFSRLVMLGGFLVVPGGMFVVFRGFLVMFNCPFRHSFPPIACKGFDQMTFATTLGLGFPS
jgi:hypothetical protein